MKTPTSAKKPAKKHGPGEYKPDIEYKRIEDLPKAKVIKENRNETHRPCRYVGSLPDESMCTTVNCMILAI